MDRLGTQVFYNWSQSLEANINETFKRLLVESRSMAITLFRLQDRNFLCDDVVETKAIDT
eukprot:4086216-Amphidinium_carterae.1